MKNTAWRSAFQERKSMPELPEVETICKGIRPHIIGRKIERISHSGKKLRTPVPIDTMRETLTGKTIIGVHRRAKYLLIQLEDGSLLAIHLGMTGNLGIFSPDREIAKHCHLQFFFSDNTELRYTDVRRFGSVQVINADEASAIESTLFRATGPEPFSDGFNAEYLIAKAHKRSIPVKTFIMTNQIVAGIGNIYANESLFKAGIDPRRCVSTIDLNTWKILIERIRKVLNHAIECGGSTISDYVNADQERGYFQINFQVYGREGEKCSRCKGDITKTNIGGRASYHCLSCQF